MNQVVGSDIGFNLLSLLLFLIFIIFALTFHKEFIRHVIFAVNEHEKIPIAIGNIINIYKRVILITCGASKHDISSNNFSYLEFNSIKKHIFGRIK